MTLERSSSTKSTIIKSIFVFVLRRRTNRRRIVVSETAWHDNEILWRHCTAFPNEEGAFAAVESLIGKPWRYGYIAQA